MRDAIRGIAASLLITAGGVATAEQAGVPVFESGSYDLRLVVKQMPPGKDNVVLPAEVEVSKDSLVIRTQGMTGNKVTLRGIVEDGALKVGLTDVEEGSLLSFHCLSKVSTPTEAKGTLICFMDGKTAFRGEWMLTKAAGTPGKTGGN